MRKIINEIAMIVTIMFFVFLIFGQIDLLEKLYTWSLNHEEFEIDEILSTSVVFVFLLLIFSIRRWIDLRVETNKLRLALAELRTIKGIIPICAYCKRIRNEEGAWDQLEAYFQSRIDAQFSHGICNSCYEKEMEKPDEFDEK